jgi:NTP pyrophosphatase (non-canonical NTP hydrolase)
MSQEHPPLTGDTVRTTDILFQVNAVLNRFRKAGTQEYFAPAPSQQEQLAEVHDAIADVLITAALSPSPAIEGEQKDQYQIALKETLAEVRRAKSMFPDNFHNQHEGIAVAWEEVDELWEEVKKNQRNYDLEAQRKEAIQCAAMFIRFAAELTPVTPNTPKP